MSGVIVVDAESFRSTCFGHGAYIHDHCLDMLITMLNSVNCSIVICSPTVEYLCSWEKPLVKPMAPGSIFHHINLPTLSYFYYLLFYFASLSQKYQKYYPIISIRSHSRKWPCRDWHPLTMLVARIYLFCVGARDSRVASYWIDTLVLKNWGKYLRYFAASPFPFQGKTNAVLKR